MLCRAKIPARLCSALLPPAHIVSCRLCLPAVPGSKHDADMSLVRYDWDSDANLDVDLVPIEGKGEWQERLSAGQEFRELLQDSDQRYLVAKPAAQILLYMVCCLQPQLVNIAT